MTYLVFDIEGTKLPKIDPWTNGSYLCSIGVKSNTDGYKDYLFNHIKETCVNPEQAIQDIQQRIDKSDIIVAHNAKFDVNWFRHIGLNVDNVELWCTMVADYLLYGQSKRVGLALNDLAARRKLGQKVDKMKQYWDAGFETDEIPWEQVHKVYLQQDVELTEQIFLQQYKEIEDAGLMPLMRLCCEVSKLLSEMELNGLYFDTNEAEVLHKQYTENLVLIDLQLKQLAGVNFNVGSSEQLRAILFGGAIKHEIQELIAKPRKNGSYRVYTRKAVSLRTTAGLGFEPHESTLSKKTGQFSTGKNARKWLHWETNDQQRFLELLEDRANAAKFCSTLHSKDGTKDSGLIAKALNTKDRKLHPSFNQTIAATGRLTSSNPNGQNFARAGTSPIKTLIKSKHGFIVNADLSQIEWRIAASLSNDKTMIQEIWDGLDVHLDSAIKFFGGKEFRQQAKTFNFRMIYNGGPTAYFYDGGMPRFTLEKWKEIVAGFWEKYKGLRGWQTTNRTFVDNAGFIRNPSGRYLTFHYYSGEEDPTSYKVGYNFNDICNYPVQSASADIMFMCLVEINRAIKRREMQTKLILQVHDSVVADCPSEEVYEFGKICLDTFKDVPRLAKEYFGWEISVPVTGEVEIGKNYGVPIEHDGIKAKFKEHEFKKDIVDTLTSYFI